MKKSKSKRKSRKIKKITKKSYSPLLSIGLGSTIYIFFLIGIAISIYNDSKPNRLSSVGSRASSVSIASSVGNDLSNTTNENKIIEDKTKNLVPIVAVATTAAAAGLMSIVKTDKNKKVKNEILKNIHKLAVNINNIIVKFQK